MKTLSKIKKLGILSLMCFVGLTGTVSCSDEPDSENFYTFTGEMMTDYLRNRPQYSEFYEIVSRAGLTDLLSTYGHYTCFVPSNTAVEAYLKDKGLSSLNDLTDADCDTIARTHLVNNMYTTFDLPGGKNAKVPTANMLGRWLQTSWNLDNDSNMVVYLEGRAHILFDQKDDSVENGIMQPIDQVIVKSTEYIDNLLSDNPKITTYYAALLATGVINEIQTVEDTEWNPKGQKKYRYKSHTWQEVAWVPDTKKYGHTVFVVTDSILQAKYGIAKGDMQALYNLACKLYDPVFPDDINKEGHDFNHLTDSVNPLRRFMQYHVLNKAVPTAADLTPYTYTKGTKVKTAGIDESLQNPCDWHYTLLPRTMLKVEKLTLTKYTGNSKLEERYINRRYDKDYQIEGQWIDPVVETEYQHDGLNGHYFYVDDVVAFDEQTQNIVQNVRIRMDFSTVFPEVIDNGLRYEGTWYDDSNDVPDDAATPKNGRNYYFPMGYLDGVTFNYPLCNLVLRRPHSQFWSWQGDEWNIFGDYDFTFRIPPVPFTGEWQLRLGFCSIPTRGVMQVYFDGVAQGIPLDMTKDLNSGMYLGQDYWDQHGSTENYDKMTDEEKAEEQKLLKNLGAYREGRANFNFNQDGNSFSPLVGATGRYRRILCQTNIDATKDHYVRFRVASNGSQGNNNEFMLDYFELVPKSVYGVGGSGDMEDDL